MAVDAINNVGASFRTRSILDGFVGFGAPQIEASRFAAQVKTSEILKQRNNNDNNRLNDPVQNSRGIFQNQNG